VKTYTRKLYRISKHLLRPVEAKKGGLNNALKTAVQPALFAD
jgi:hypothetical protein